ncbi:MAG: hypothetical protein AVDCRST_MAG28-3280 [uncultured Rubrobacteraceae bacterium]|uniref:HTH cro/C1-type domain-containing protein n=1 Tax=uncultured Rubrobacteraceae bacterium TaxID=349277 RepID=A0A6J4R116_9ACTN|nr:MAG: hypothetical protein AVDCRST_MAG28-3280 [uncultured Rubrobacteraceae bacterium]
MLIPNLRYWRERRALTQEELAEKANVGARSIAGYEAGAGARPGNVRKLAGALDIDVSALMMEEEPAPKTPAPSPEILEVEDWERRRATITGLTIVATRLRIKWAEELQQGGLAEHRAMEISFAIKGVLENAESQGILGGLDHTGKADAKQVKRLREELERLVGLYKLAVEQSITGFKFESIVDGVVLEQVSASPVETARKSHA